MLSPFSSFVFSRLIKRYGTPMRSDLVEQAAEIYPDPQILVNLVSKRVRQLNSGRAPLVDTVPSMGVADVALTELIEGKIKLIEKPQED